MKNRKNKLYSFLAGFIFAAVLFAVFLAGFNFVLAVWQEPSLPPPGGNVPSPLNTGSIDQTKTGGLTIGTTINTSELCFGLTGTDCKTTWADVLGPWKQATNTDDIYYDTGNVAVGQAIIGLPTWPLSFAKLAINTGSAEGLYISRNSAVPYSYINVRDSLDKPVFKIHESGGVGIGIDNPNKDLHIYNIVRNAEIDLQSVAGNSYWAIYHDGPNGDESNDLRFWINNENRVNFSDVGIVTATDFCTPEGKCLADSVVTNFAGLATKAGDYNGNQGGYSGAGTGINGVCNSQFTGSHNCSADEMLIIARNPGALAGTSGYAWISTGVAGFKETLLINDCVGWTSSSGDAFGSIWKFSGASTNGGSVWLSGCDVPRKIACCY